MSNPQISVVLSLDINSVQAGFFRPFCNVHPVPQPPGQLLFLQCSKAVSEGGYLAVTIPPKKAGEAEWNGRIPNHFVLVVIDGPLHSKTMGFHAS